MKMKLSSKRLQIDKANATMFAVLVAASIIAAFSLVTVRVLFGEMRYQQRVISAKSKALKQLKENVTAAKSLEQEYQEFEKAPDNVIGGSATGTGPRDGTNAKVVLDSLPSSYDFPALATSLDGMIKATGLNIDSLTGTDKEIEEKGKSSPIPAPQEIQFGFTTTGGYDATRNLVFDLERSIRPIHLKTLEVSGNDASIRLRVNALTFYQPAKDLTLQTKDVK